LKASQKVVTPVKTGVQSLFNYLNRLDSGFRRNDKKWDFSTFYETIIIGLVLKDKGLSRPLLVSSFNDRKNWKSRQATNLTLTRRNQKRFDAGSWILDAGYMILDF